MVVANVCPAAVIPFNVYSPLLPHVALPYASEVNTAFDVIVPPVTFIVFVTSEVVVKVPVLIEVDEILPEDVKDVAVINPVVSEVDDIFPDDTTDVAVIAPAANPPVPSRLTIVFAVLEEVAEFTADDTVVIVDDKTPPTLFTTGTAAVPPKSFVNCIIPFAVDVASVADIVPEAIVIPSPAIKFPCFAFSAAYSALLNNPAIVPVTDADGIFNV